MTLLLVGAGGHAKVVVEALAACDTWTDAYVDAHENTWLPSQHLVSDEDAWLMRPGAFVLGLGGVSVAQLRRRFRLFDAYRDRDWTAPEVVHPEARVSAFSIVGEGTIVLAAAVIQPGAIIGDAVIVNTGAIIEHDCTVGSGTHIASGAILSGGCSVGTHCMIGAGAVVLHGAEVPNETLVASLTRYPARQ